MPLTPLAARYDQFILDLDGCVWVGDEPTPGAREAVEGLREAGKRVAFATNDPRSSTEDYVARLWAIGVQASLRDVVTVGGAVQHLLADTRTGKTAFVVGTPALRKHVADAGLRVLNGTDLASRAEVVIVAGTDDLTFDDLRNASLAARRGADFLATGRDPTYPQPEGLWPGTGAILAAVEVASERTAEIVGKPNPQLILTALDRLGEGRTLVVGDRVDADLAAAASAELDAALVLTGGLSAGDADGADPKPVAIADTLASLVLR
ncbi:MAG TPA: HAD-IIA family hydrolase [Thermoleophilaceae bacterium]|nr:HAD-IIA family hydrolase [Thermoleophilaceae bacterium]